LPVDDPADISPALSLTYISSVVVFIAGEGPRDI
jgi:hypothetical protein